MYGSSFWFVTLKPLASSSLPSEAAVMPFPNEETTPPVTKMYFVSFTFLYDFMYVACVYAVLRVQRYITKTQR